MKVIGINGSPRKNQNTHQMLQSALDGFSSQGYETQIYHLKDIRFNGCISCFGCKVKGSRNVGKCMLRDNLHHVINEIVDEADALIIASPIYFSDVTGMVRNFTERLLFPNCLYRRDGSVIYPRRIPVLIIYTMNCPDESIYDDVIKRFNQNYEQFLGPVTSICATDTYQFKDYSRYESEAFDPEHKKQVHETQFPADLQKAYDCAVSISNDIENNK